MNSPFLLETLHHDRLKVGRKLILAGPLSSSLNLLHHRGHNYSNFRSITVKHPVGHVSSSNLFLYSSIVHPLYVSRYCWKKSIHQTPSLLSLLLRVKLPSESSWPLENNHFSHFAMAGGPYNYSYIFKYIVIGVLYAYGSIFGCGAF